jgi:hypothetical protein
MRVEGVKGRATHLRIALVLYRVIVISYQRRFGPLEIESFSSGVPPVFWQ